MKGVNVLTVYGGANIDEQIRGLKKRSSNCSGYTRKNGRPYQKRTIESLTTYNG